MRVRAEVSGSLALAAAHDYCARPFFVNGDRKKGIALVVAQSNVEARTMRLDEVVLQHQGLDLVADLDPLD